MPYGPLHCFVEGTDVITPQGPVPIQSISVGSVVIALADSPFDISVGISEVHVVNTIQAWTDAVIDIDMACERVRTTSEHPFWVIGRGWIPAGELRAGDFLMTYHGERTRIETIQRVRLPRPLPVYNLSVSGSNTFFIGHSGILVLNKI
jgi:hypothetical protein